jgi:transposase-like protein
MDKPKVSELVEAIEKARGNVSAVARLYGRPWSTVKGWIDASQTAKQALEDARETRVDMAEMVVYKQASEENLGAAFYILNNDPKARARGWGVQRHELTGGGEDGEIAVRFLWGDNADD